MIIANRWDMFWKIHSQEREDCVGRAYSESFIDLFNHMFNFSRFERATIAEIKDHEWCKGELPTYTEVADESKRRKDMVDGCDLENEEPIPKHMPGEIK